jgi:hypothetical protein
MGERATFLTCSSPRSSKLSGTRFRTCSNLERGAEMLHQFDRHPRDRGGAPAPNAPSPSFGKPSRWPPALGSGPARVARQAADRNRCLNYGFQEGTDAYAQWQNDNRPATQREPRGYCRSRSFKAPASTLLHATTLPPTLTCNTLPLAGAMSSTNLPLISKGPCGSVPCRICLCDRKEVRMWLLMKLLKRPTQTPHGGDNLGLGKADGR